MALGDRTAENFSGANRTMWVEPAPKNSRLARASNARWGGKGEKNAHLAKPCRPPGRFDAGEAREFRRMCVKRGRETGTPSLSPQGNGHSQLPQSVGTVEKPGLEAQHSSRELPLMERGVPCGACDLEQSWVSPFAPRNVRISRYARRFQGRSWQTNNGQNGNGRSRNSEPQKRERPRSEVLLLPRMRLVRLMTARQCGGR